MDEQVIADQERIKEAIKQGFLILAESYASKDWPIALNMLVDTNQPTRVRVKAAEILGDYGQ